MRTYRVGNPKFEPVTLEEAKAYLRVTSTFEDPIIRALITSARQQCESVARITIVPQTWITSFRAPSFSNDEFNLTPSTFDPERIGQWAALPNPPTMSVHSVHVTDRNGVSRPMPLVEGQPQWSFSADNGIVRWRDPRYLLSPDVSTIEIEYTAGLNLRDPNVPEKDQPDAMELPGDLRIAILETLSETYMNRGDFAGGLPARARMLLQHYRNTTRYMG